MIFQIARLLVAGFVVLTIVYVIVSLYSRSVRRGKLEREWEERGRPGDRDAWIAAGMEEYEHSLRRKLIWGVYVVPLAIVAVIFYLVNYG